MAMSHELEALGMFFRRTISIRTLERGYTWQTFLKSQWNLTMNPMPLLLLVATFPAEAKTSEALFGKLDHNHDGNITAEEIPDSQRSFFKRALRVADRNEDGSLTSEELAVALKDPKPVQLPGTNSGNRMAEMDFKQFDKNSDGKLTIDEIPAAGKERFQELLDRAGQKEISIDIIARYMAGERPKQASDGSKKDAVKADDKAESMKSDQPEIEPSNTKKKPDERAQGLQTLIRQLDKNGDGKLSKAELPPRMKEFADRMDADGDGIIEAKELAAAMKRREPKK
jgi:Ca2+-binding EF-hand superfamily protein